jgi:dTDP-4-amino-4,6-dideoxygalactose transaminase
MLYYARQFIDNDDIDSVVKVLRSNSITQGPKLDEFEKLVSLNVNANYAVAVNSATSALHLSCLALGVLHQLIVLYIVAQILTS